MLEICSQTGEAGRLEREISRMESDLESLYCEIGKSVLELLEREGGRANRLVDQIVEARTRLVELQDMTKQSGGTPAE